MAKRVGVGKDTVAKIWADHNVKPWQVKTFKVSNDPRFEEKIVDVVGVYLNPPARAVVFSFDGKTQCQALDRTQPSLPMTAGRAGTMTHDYKRNGTVDLFAAMNGATGQVLSDLHKGQPRYEAAAPQPDQVTGDSLGRFLEVEQRDRFGGGGGCPCRGQGWDGEQVGGEVVDDRDRYMCGFFEQWQHVEHREAVGDDLGQDPRQPRWRGGSAADRGVDGVLDGAGRSGRPADVHHSWFASTGMSTCDRLPHVFPLGAAPQMPGVGGSSQMRV